MINWTQEDVEYIIKNMIMPCINAYSEEMDKIKKIEHDSFDKVLLTFANRIREIDYEQIRDRTFFMRMFIEKFHYDKEELYDAYHKWITEYDKLNKHILEYNKEED